MSTCLKKLEILVLDCQTTGSHPDNAYLLEIGWACIRAKDLKDASDLEVINYLFSLPEDLELPRSIERLTGISTEDLLHASEPKQIWEHLAVATRRMTARSRFPACPTVIHFARFETPFLRKLHQQYGGNDPYPLDVICSHEISKRLLPGLPRKGLRAVAGYFGHSVPMAKRCSAHLVATAIIWKHLVGLLEKEAGIHTLDELKGWLDNSKAETGLQPVYPMPGKKRLTVSGGPGIYKMLRSNGDLLYIGKAGSLKQRVNSYFQKSSRHAEHILEMLSQAADLKVTPTATALEAALLESEEIKRLDPPYNKALRGQGRRLWFCSRDFRDCSEVPDARHRTGPIPVKSICRAVYAIGALLEDSRTNIPVDKHFSPSVLLSVPVGYAPDEDCMLAGVSTFMERHRERMERGNAWRALLAVGTLSWRKRMEEQDKLTEDDRDLEGEAGSEDEENKDRVWTPEAVSRSLESVLRHCAFLIRRARWMTLLSESALSWCASDKEERSKSVLLFKAGAVVDRQTLKSEDLLPVPPGYDTAFRDRQTNLDLITYDRLRVLTTELRRLITEGRTVSIRLGPRTVLRSEQIRRVLRWV
jgi:DNA polymerase-3 subunit epsilon